MSAATAASATAPAWTEVDWRPHLRDAEIAGRRLRYVDYGEGPALLLVHGLGGAWTTWLENIPALGRENRVIAIDLPGFGASELPPPPADLGTWVEAILFLLDQLGIDRVMVAGHSLGGLVACRLALEHPARVRGLVLVNAGGVSLGRLQLALIVRSFLGVDRLIQRPGVMRALARRPRLRRAMLRTFLRDPRSMSGELAVETIPLMSAPGFTAGVRAGATAAADTDASRIEAPTLLVWGRHDRILTLAQAERLAAVLPDARLEVVDEAAHCPMFERAGEFNEHVAAFSRDLA